MMNFGFSNDMLKCKSIYTIGSIAALLQLVTILGYSVALGVLGPKPPPPPSSQSALSASYPPVRRGSSRA